MKQHARAEDYIRTAATPAMGIAHCLLRGRRPGVLLGLSLLWVFCQPMGTPLAHAQAQPETIRVQNAITVNPTDGLTYASIPPGTFQMGCSPPSNGVTGLGGAPVKCVDSEEPAHSVTLTRGFRIGQTQVTQAAYMKLMGKNPSHFRGDTLPVDGVSFNDATAYCGRVGMRLPTEAEWEYAARGGNPSALYGPLKEIAWFNAGGDPKGGTTHPVATKKANDFGLYDMIGNVWEWVSDWYAPYDAAPATDPKGPATGKYHVVRGGSWDETSDTMRVEFRNRVMTGISDDYNGFRCASN